jgi:hypothetical protein
MKQSAGREGVLYEIVEYAKVPLLKLYYQPCTQAVIMQKTAEGAKVEVHPLGPDDHVMARIYCNNKNEFYLDRECIGGFDKGGPWVREYRTLKELNKYLAIFGLRNSKTTEFSIVILNKPVDP